MVVVPACLPSPPNRWQPLGKLFLVASTMRSQPSTAPRRSRRSHGDTLELLFYPRLFISCCHGGDRPTRKARIALRRGGWKLPPCRKLGRGPRDGASARSSSKRRGLRAFLPHHHKNMCVPHMPAAKHSPPACLAKTHPSACLAHHDISIPCQRTRIGRASPAE